MRPISLGTALALAGLAHSQGTLPSCAQGCVTQFTSGSQIASCGNLDIKCICSNSSFLSSVACCLAAACNASDQAAAVLYAKQICTTAGVTVPDAVVCVSSTTAVPATSVTSARSSVGSTTGTLGTSPTSAAPVSASSSSASASPSATKNVGIQNAAGAGMSFVGGLAAMLALL